MHGSCVRSHIMQALDGSPHPIPHDMQHASIAVVPLPRGHSHSRVAQPSSPSAPAQPVAMASKRRPSTEPEPAKPSKQQITIAASLQRMDAMFEQAFSRLPASQELTDEAHVRGLCGHRVVLSKSFAVAWLGAPFGYSESKPTVGRSQVYSCVFWLKFGRATARFANHQNYLLQGLNSTCFCGFA